MTAVEFGDLPPSTTRPWTKWREVFELLKTRPGDWAKVTTTPTASTASSIASKLRRGQLGEIPEGEIEAVNRGMDVWARYIGDPS
jgi:hypothetical protein